MSYISKVKVGNEVRDIKDAEARNYSKFNVKNYGAYGDGTHNDTTAIQNAINDCITHGGGCVYLPDGEYIITSITVNSSEVSIIGSGETSTIIRTSANIYAIKFLGSSSTSESKLFNIAIKNLSIRSGIENSNVVYIWFENVGSGRIQNVHLQQYSKGYTGIYFKNVYQTFIVNVEETDLVNGLVVDTFANDIYISNSRFDGNTGYGINITGCEGLFVDNVTCYGNKQAALISGCKNVFASNFICDTSELNNLQINNTDRAKFTNCWFGDNSTESGTMKYNNVDVSTSNSVVFASCTFVKGSKCGIAISSSEYLIINGCLFEDNCWDAGTEFALLLTYSAHITVNNNIFKHSAGKQPNGIRTYGSGTTNYYVIVGNDIRATTPIQDDAAGSNKQISLNITSS